MILSYTKITEVSRGDSAIVIKFDVSGPHLHISKANAEFLLKGLSMVLHSKETVFPLRTENDLVFLRGELPPGYGG